jgi:type IV pilus assembly protein PilA
MKSQPQGFMLIELVIVIMIIVIIVAFALSSYFNYIKQAKVTEAAVLFDGFKTNVSIWYMSKGTYPTFMDLKVRGIVYKGAFVEGYYDDSMATTGTPQVCFKVMGFEAGKDSIGWKYIHDPSFPDQMVWSCRAPESDCTTIRDRYLPFTCQP